MTTENHDPLIPKPLPVVEPAEQTVERLLAEQAKKPTWQNFMDEARAQAAQCWGHPETQDRIMDVALAEVVAKQIAFWMETAAMFNRNSDFYLGLIVQVGEMFGDAAKTCDDGSLCQDVLALKVPELVNQALSSLRGENQRLRDLLLLDNPEPSSPSIYTQQSEEIEHLRSRLAIQTEALKQIAANELTPHRCNDPSCWPCGMWEIAIRALAQSEGKTD